MTVTLDRLRTAGILAPLDVRVAEALGRIGGEARPEVLLAVGLASRAVRQSHVCLDLGRLAAGAVPSDEAGRPVPGAQWPALDAWLAALRSSSLVGGADVDTPLVLDAENRLYLRRYWDYQTQLARGLGARAGQRDASVAASALAAGLDRLFPPGPWLVPGDIDGQRLAAMLAVQRRLCVISGGPGTGKTYTVAKILALLIEQALHAGRRPPAVMLAAPTGKAAARLAEAIKRSKADLPCDDTVKALIPESASTLHRCLGVSRDRATVVQYHADNPLAADLVVVDEASMVDLALMARLVDAVPPSARLILLGDKDQLLSVEAGAVLGDICHGAAAPQGTGIGDCIVHLMHSHRFGPDSGIGRLARAVNEGDAGAALAILDDAALPDVTLAEPAPRGELSAALRQSVTEGFGHYLREADAAVRLGAFDRFRILCGHRRGRHGVETVNRQVEAVLSEAGLVRIEGPVYAGRPIIVTHNDYQLNLFNGDVGLIVENPDGGNAAVFGGAGATLRFLSPARLPPYETVFAMSVHKSQGSEFDEIAVLLPDRDSPILSRELLYTAVTRARKKVVIHAPRDVVAEAVARRAERASGLSDALRGGVGGGAG